MSRAHHRFWPKGCPEKLDTPETTLSHNLDVSALRYPGKAAIIFYDSVISYGRLKREVDAMAGYLQNDCGVQRGDRVLLFSQNCPQFVVAYYAILRAGAVVVPANTMSTTPELRHYIEDSGARVAFAAQELCERLLPCLSRDGIERIIVHCYADYLFTPTTLPLPEVLAQPRKALDAAGVVAWTAAMAPHVAPSPQQGRSGDLSCCPILRARRARPRVACTATAR